MDDVSEENMEFFGEFSDYVGWNLAEFWVNKAELGGK